MKIEEYSNQAITTLAGDEGLEDITPTMLAQILGLFGESAEIAEKFKKIIRDKNGRLSEEDKGEILKELGDVLWYVNSVSTLLGGSLEEVAKKNLEKLSSRKDRGMLKGSGDNR